MSVALTIDVAEHASFEELWRQSDLARRTAGLTPGQTLRTQAQVRDDRLSARLAALPRLLAPGADGAPPELALGRKLGEGGMGVVRVARQMALGREVAVKSLRPQVRSDDARRRMLAEAMVAGQLEHPDILPIYALGQDEAGAPLLVMKRVDGVSWHDVLGQPDHPLLEGAEPLAWHLEVLMRVCRAVHFAHARGILHRDLKTDNVMIGRYGEVYVLDWGLAVTTTDDGSGSISLASAANEVVGTPAAMAPEMVTGKGSLLGPHTDVFLLGAMLHEIVTGRPRHSGADIHAVLWAAFVCTPATYGGDVPAELAEVARTACAREPGDRHASADDLRRAIATFLEHRASMRLLQSAQGHSTTHAEAIFLGREALAVEVAAAYRAAEDQRRAAPSETEAMEGALRSDAVEAAIVAVARTFDASRLALQESVRAWPGNEAAHRAEHALLLAHAWWLLDLHDVAAAESLALELERLCAARAEAGATSGATAEQALVREELQQLRPKLAEVRATAQSHVQLQQRRRDDADPTIGARTRAFLSLVLGMSWTIIPIGAEIARTRLGWRLQPWMLVASGVGFLLAIVAAATWARESMLRSRLNRDVLAATAVCAMAVTFGRSIGIGIGLGVDAIVALDLYTFGLTMALIVAMAWPRLWLTAPIYFVGAAVATLRPELSLWSEGLSNFGALLLAAFLWRPRDYERFTAIRVASIDVGRLGSRHRRRLPQCDPDEPGDAAATDGAIKAP